MSVLEGLSAVGRVTRDTLNMLIGAKSELKRLLVSWNGLLHLFLLVCETCSCQYLCIAKFLSVVIKLLVYVFFDKH